MNDLNALRNDKLVFYDGQCALCHWAVRFLIRYDKKSYFKFIALQSETAKAILTGITLPTGLDSIVFLENKQLYIKSDAILRMTRYLPCWKYLYYLKFIPGFIRDGIYDLVARVRYSIFGRATGCPLPGPEFTDRFIS